jgi:hypothetical protein
VPNVFHAFSNYYKKPTKIGSAVPRNGANLFATCDFRIASFLREANPIFAAFAPLAEFFDAQILYRH